MGLGLLCCACVRRLPATPDPPVSEVGEGEENLFFDAEPRCPVPELLGPAVLPENVYQLRFGHKAKRFSEIVTRQTSPLEECGLTASLTRLVTLQCDDGSNPFGGSRDAAHRSRRGSVGPGGRCDSIIDLYDVPCPERRYEVYSDMYYCSESTVDRF